MEPCTAEEDENRLVGEWTFLSLCTPQQLVDQSGVVESGQQPVAGGRFDDSWFEPRLRPALLEGVAVGLTGPRGEQRVFGEPLPLHEGRDAVSRDQANCLTA